MAELALAVAQTLFAALQCSELKAMCSVRYYKSQLEELNKTVTTIKNVLLDAETKEMSNEQQVYIKELRDVVYEADDLFDEFVTCLELKQHQGSNIKQGSEFYKEVSQFYKKVIECLLFCFSSDVGKFSQAYRMFKKVKEIQTKLNSIVDNHKRFALGVDYKPICLRGEETCSYVDVNYIIGRDDDKKAVVKMVLESKNQDVGFLSIVGVGGLGKTAVAQLVYNDEDVQREFGDQRFWVCVSDQDKQQFDVKAILCKILGQTTFEGYTMQSVQQKIQEKWGEKKYMLVLDDVWNEDRDKWVKLQKFLMFGKEGSRVVVTTRSEMTAAVVGDGDHTYWLPGLSPENSWDLFKMVAFNQGNYQQKEFLEVGEKIVAKCCNIPLAIRVVGSLLYGQDIKKWKSVEEIGLSKFKEGDNQLMSVLKLSYYNLISPLKSCFTYCALFPKDYEIEKERLIHLWMAEGYIVPADQGGQRIADVAEEYFLILLRRCFFQDVYKDDVGHIQSVKIHDLLHDVAQAMAGKEIQIGGNNIGDEVRHWSFYGENGSQISFVTTKLRSYICLSFDVLSRRSQLVPKQLKCLRVLELQHLDDIKSLKSIGELLHLRYLVLVYGTFETFPSSSIAKLRNLQTFILHFCHQLRELPHDFSKLEKLVHIEITGCIALQTMPSLSKLPYLKSLVLVELDILHYIEKSSSFVGAEETPFFPSLEYLHITGDNELKGWTGVEVDHCQSIRRFPCLSRLKIFSCPVNLLVTFAPCPSVKTLYCDKLEIIKQVVGKDDGTSLLATLTIFDWQINELENDIMLWKALNQSLRTLIFDKCNFESLPKGMQHLTSLQTLKILSCDYLNALPEWISCLTSLQHFKTRRCSRELYERCSGPYGADWPKIQHIPNITICK